MLVVTAALVEFRHNVLGAMVLVVARLVARGDSGNVASTVDTAVWTRPELRPL